MNPLWYIPISAAVLYLLWIHFLAVMQLRDALKRGVLTLAAKVPGYPVLFVGLVLDFLGNIIATFILLDIPREFTVSRRIKRLCNTSAGWRYRTSCWIRDNWLKPFDRWGGHD